MSKYRQMSLSRSCCYKRDKCCNYVDPYKYAPPSRFSYDSYAYGAYGLGPYYPNTYAFGYVPYGGSSWNSIYPYGVSDFSSRNFYLDRDPYVGRGCCLY